jgi:hypothetical protein
MSAKSVLIAWPIVNWNETLYEKPGFAAVQAGLGHFSDDRGHLPPIWLAGVSFRHVWHPDYDFYSPRSLDMVLVVLWPLLLLLCY